MNIESPSIVMITNAYFPATEEGGPAFSNRELAESMVRAGARVSVLTTDRNGSGRLDVPVDQWTTVGGVLVYYAKTKSGAWIRGAKIKTAIEAAIKDAQVCLMSAVFWNYSGLRAWQACRVTKTPYISYARGLLSPWALRHKGLKKMLYWKLISRRILNGSRAIVALAEMEAIDITRMKLTPPIVVIPNGASRDIAGSVTEPEGTREEMPHASSSGDYLLYLGRVHAKKGMDLLLDAFHKCLANCTTANLLIAGPIDSAYKVEFDRLLSRCAARDRVKMLGTVVGTEKFRLLRNAKAFILPSYGEGLPVAALEAMSVGTPVIITRNCNLPEVTAAHAGIEVGLDSDSIAAAICAIWNNDELRSQLSGNAVRLIREKFSWDSVGAKTVELCRSVIAEA